MSSPANEVILIARGNLRHSANKVCWPAQVEVERAVTEAFAAEGISVRRAHAYRKDLGHGFIYNQRMGVDVFKNIHPEAKIIVLEAVWQYSHNVLAGAATPSRPDPHHRQLVRSVARSGWHAQPQRLPSQGRRTLQHHLEQGLQ